jgi:hypothetical protein
MTIDLNTNVSRTKLRPSTNAKTKGSH